MASIVESIQQHSRPGSSTVLAPTATSRVGTGRKSRFSWVRRLVSSAHHKPSSSPHRDGSSSTAGSSQSSLGYSRRLYEHYHHNVSNGLSPTPTTSSSLEPLYHYRSLDGESESTSVVQSLPRSPSPIAYSVSSRSSSGNYVFSNVFGESSVQWPPLSTTASACSSTTGGGRTRATGSFVTSTTATTGSTARSPSILSSSSSATNNTIPSSLMTVPPPVPAINYAQSAHNPSHYSGHQQHFLGAYDSASVMTLASSSKRRRKSVDTNASTRALAPESLFGGSRESLPLTVATGRTGSRRSAAGRSMRSMRSSRWAVRSPTESDNESESGSESEREESDIEDDQEQSAVEEPHSD
ncbi:uncharacterized protein V2V93DRAFT_376059 [Kockiozyma suomiensis]|uniref:uncharacterized protein n=1 Tax=Kockiozyma suomiensis TaxID=1337062 RepID=UPI003343833A